MLNRKANLKDKLRKIYEANLTKQKSEIKIISKKVKK